MKKFFAAVLAILYLTTSTGTTIYMHYCMERLVEWGLGDSNSSKCSKCGTSGKQGLLQRLAENLTVLSPFFDVKWYVFQKI
jgi:hypothetical protein